MSLVDQKWRKPYCMSNKITSFEKFNITFLKQSFKDFAYHLEKINRSIAACTSVWGDAVELLTQFFGTKSTFSELKLLLNRKSTPFLFLFLLILIERNLLLSFFFLFLFYSPIISTSILCFTYSQKIWIFKKSEGSHLYVRHLYLMIQDVVRLKVYNTCICDFLWHFVFCDAGHPDDHALFRVANSHGCFLRQSQWFAHCTTRRDEEE